jgi:hypothetical protein
MDARVAVMAEAVDACATVPLWPLDAAGCIQTLDAVVAAERQLLGLKLRLVRRIDAGEMAKGQGATSTAVWLRGRYRIAVGTARKLVELARAVADGPRVLRRAVLGGGLDPEQVQTITSTLARVPLAARGEVAARLVDEAGRWDAPALAQMGALIRAAVATGAADAEGIEALERAEQRAHRDRFLTIRPRRDGSGYHVDGRLSTEQAAVVNAALDPLCKPQAADERTPGQRRADAIEEVCRLALNTTDLPENGGTGRRWWSPPPSMYSPNNSAPARWTPGNASAPPPCASCAATPCCCPRCSAPRARCWTWAGNGACSPARSAAPWCCATAAAPFRTATGHHGHCDGVRETGASPRDIT